MSEYLILIYTDEARFPEPVGDEVDPSFLKFMSDNQHVLLGGAGLQRTGTATTVRRDGDGSFAVTDGAFAETKEALGGYFLIDVPDLDAAISVARQIPQPWGGGVEVRPLRVRS
ncbi:YciI family protein [Sinomonas sp. ASV486]|uniref:YciI family protein n=1 Tax=Sinomonas puerhi TaxID=3238584 RepID=A0AB39L6L2_9MICC|nr:YciI family protein [Sinomonas sp. ASV486]MDQ4489890.1 YciI family protein [Sinomonas sp. ASV486]